MKYLLVGLGNIGIEYDNTRHNIGFHVVDEIAQFLKSEFLLEKNSFLSITKYKSRKVYLLKPTLYMNNSGNSVRYWKDKLNISIQNVLVISDDIHLPFGKIRIKVKGSSGGHNGLKDIENKLNTNHYCRLRIGIGNSFSLKRQSEYVLSKFTHKEQEELGSIIFRAREAALSFIFYGINYAMNNFN